MERNEFLEKVLAYGKEEGFAECEVFYRGGKAFEVLIMEGEVSNYENCREEGLAFRGNIDGRTGYAYTERLTEEAIPYLVNMAKENAALLSPEDMEDLYEGEESYPELEGVNEELEQLEVSEKISAAMKMEQAALAGAEEVASLDYCALGTGLQRSPSKIQRDWMFPLRKTLPRLMYLLSPERATKPKQALISGKPRTGRILTPKRQAERRQNGRLPIWGQAL